MKYTIALLLAAVALQLSAQDKTFAQHLNTRTNLNPAMVGVDSSFMTSYAMRFENLDSDFDFQVISRISTEQYIHALRGGIGIEVINENQGDGIFVNNSYTLNYAPRFKMFNSKLTAQLGITTTYFENNANWDRVSYKDLYGGWHYSFYYPRAEPMLSKRTGWDFSTGLFVYTNNIYGGIGIFHVTQPDEGLLTFSKLPIRITANFGGNLNATSNLTISPNVVFAKQQDFYRLDMGLNVKYKPIVAGILLHIEDDGQLTPNIGFQNRFLKISYSYGFSVSDIQNKYFQTHEIHLIGFIHYQKKPSKRKSIRFI